MDVISIAGTILAFVVLIVGAILKGTDVSALWNPAAFVIVFIGTISALLLHTQGKVLKRALGMLKMVYKPPQLHPSDLISRVIGWSEISRRQGLLGLEPHIDAEDDPLVKKGLQLLVDGSEPEAIRSVLELEVETREQADLHAAKVYEQGGIYSPTMGIIGAVLGLMAVMRDLTDPAKLGHGIAAAFVATIYGISLANLLLLPIGARLKGLITKQTQVREILIEGLISIAEGDNPRQIESKLQGYLV
ncbi:flagellar motor protein [Dyella sp.]|jgi:chemotaxis protein MotA|uniref:flagellar motor protein n=1 Tax=Dyella sp. TaxID=1869338 RepID=UPI002D774953|nr:flagellar motor protein [Dyella sp.]HET7330896.1 flagellar motor protein [Dyella sp.]